MALGKMEGSEGRAGAREIQASTQHVSTALALTSALSFPSTWRRRGWERGRAPVGIGSPSLSGTQAGAERGSPWVSDQRAQQSPRALPASNYQDKDFRNNGYCRIAYSPRGFDPKPNEVGGKTPIDFNRLYVRLLVCCWWLCL